MRAVIQRVKSASVAVAGTTVAAIGRGLVILLGLHNDDSEADAQFMAGKVAGLRIFEDEGGKFNLSALDVGAELLVVSQFTLYGDCRKGRRPSFTEAAPPEISHPLYDAFVRHLRESGLKIEEGVFGAKMLVAINNEGPVTLIVDSKN